MTHTTLTIPFKAAAPRAANQRTWDAQAHAYRTVPTSAETIVRRVLHQDARTHIGRMAAGSAA